MTCVFFDQATWLEWPIYFFVKLNIQSSRTKKMITLIKMANDFYSSGTSSQVGQKQMTTLVTMANNFLVMWTSNKVWTKTNDIFGQDD
jgi:hypothetical protein